MITSGEILGADGADGVTAWPLRFRRSNIRPWGERLTARLADVPTVPLSAAYPGAIRGRWRVRASDGAHGQGRRSARPWGRPWRVRRWHVHRCGARTVPTDPRAHGAHGADGGDGAFLIEW